METAERETHFVTGDRSNRKYFCLEDRELSTIRRNQIQIKANLYFPDTGAVAVVVVVLAISIFYTESEEAVEFASRN